MSDVIKERLIVKEVKSGRAIHKLSLRKRNGEEYVAACGRFLDKNDFDLDSEQEFIYILPVQRVGVVRMCNDFKTLYKKGFIHYKPSGMILDYEYRDVIRFYKQESEVNHD